ncbi:MAG: pentapeptide repeat-containing protein [candidate division Zixibacteria bacterium]|nr:pentapeptide repeat-containing protein [candidate division Zixibacteria bacterium]
MYLIDFETVYEVKLSRLGSSQTEAQYREFPIELNDRQKGVTLNETYRISQELLSKIGLSTAVEEPIMRRMLKFRKRFEKKAAEGTVYELDDDDVSLFNPVRANYDRIDSDLARIIYSYFYHTSNPNLEVSDLDISLLYEGSSIRNRVKFFIQFGFLEWAVGQNTIVKLAVGGLRALKNYIDDSRKEDFPGGSSERLSGARDVHVEQKFPLEVSASSGLGQAVTLEKVSISTTCKYVMNDESECGRLLYGTDSHCVLHSSAKDKNIDAFLKEVRATFDNPDSETVDLSGVEFPDCHWIPRRGSFNKRIIFSNCRFDGVVDFSRRQFEKHVIIKNCVFVREVLFQEARFSELTLDFPDFHVGASFEGCTITGRAKLANLRPLPPAIRFTSVSLHDVSKVEFWRIDMKKVSLGGTNIRGIRMAHLAFQEKGRQLLWGRQLAGDEVALEETIGTVSTRDEQGRGDSEPSLRFELLAALYRDLQANYSDAGEYSRANWFYVSEKEMERRGWSWGKQLISLHTYYRLFSNCGQSLLLPILWVLFLVVPVFTLIMVGIGDIDGLSWSSSGSVRVFLDACLKNFTMIFNRQLAATYLAKQSLNQFLNIVETGAVLSLLSLVVVAAGRRLRNRNL